MKVIDPGHRYTLNELDVKIPDLPQYLTFVKREGPNYPGNVGHYPGTTIQEVCRCLIDRLKLVFTQEPCDEDIAAISNLRETIWLLERRAAWRHGRNWPQNVDDKFWMHLIETYPTCNKCGHIGCKGSCH